MGEGVRSWMRHCPYCKKSYRLTNFMMRPGWDREARRRNDSHLLACRLRRLFLDKLHASDPAHPFCRIAQERGEWQPPSPPATPSSGAPSPASR